MLELNKQTNGKYTKSVQETDIDTEYHSFAH